MVLRVSSYSDFSHFDSDILRLGVPFSLETHAEDRRLGELLSDLIQGDLTTLNVLQTLGNIGTGSRFVSDLYLEGDWLSDGLSLADDCLMLPDGKQVSTSCLSRHLLPRFNLPEQIIFLVVSL